MSSRSTNPELKRQARIFLRIASAVFIASLVLWSGTLAYDISTSGKSGSDGQGGLGGLIKRITNGPKVLSGDALLATGTNEKVDNSALKKGLPSTMDGWTVQGPQPVPGTDGSVVEAVFTPKDEEMSLVAPLVVYVQLQKSPSDSEALAAVKNKASQYPSGAGRSLIEGQEFVIGYSEDSRARFSGMTQGRITVWMDASYSQVIPVDKPRVKLEQASQEVAKAVLLALKKAQGSL